MVFNPTFNNISVISWWSVLLVGDTGIPGETHRHIASHCFQIKGYNNYSSIVVPIERVLSNKNIALTTILSIVHWIAKHLKFYINFYKTCHFDASIILVKFWHEAFSSRQFRLSHATELLLVNIALSLYRLYWKIYTQDKK